MNPYAPAGAHADAPALTVARTDIHFEESWLLGELGDTLRAAPAPARTASLALAPDPALPLPAPDPRQAVATLIRPARSTHRRAGRSIGPLPVGAAIVAAIGYALNVFLNLSIATSVLGGFVLATLGALALRPLLIGGGRPASTPSSSRSPSPSSRSLRPQGPR